MNAHETVGDTQSADSLSFTIAFGISMPKIRTIERLAHGPATITQLGTACGYTRNGVERHLEALEGIGLVSCTVARVEGACRPTRRYTLDADRLEDIRWALHDLFDVIPAELQRTA